MAALSSEPPRPSWSIASKNTSGDKSKASAVLDDQNEECTICFDRKVTIHFLPCKHGACSNCVESLRRGVIFKVSACSLKCPDEVHAICMSLQTSIHKMRSKKLLVTLLGHNASSRRAYSAEQYIIGKLES